MGIATIIGEGFHLANTIIDEFVTDPASKAKARRMYFDKLAELRAKIREEKDYEKIDALLLELIAAVHDK